MDVAKEVAKFNEEAGTAFTKAGLALLGIGGANRNISPAAAFFAHLRYKLREIQCRGVAMRVEGGTHFQKIDTAATDGQHLWYNPEFILKITEPERVGVLCHEIMHCFEKGVIVGGMDKPIEEIRPGDTVLGTYGKLTTVKRIASRDYTGEIVTIKARGLLPFRVTTEHPIQVTRPRWRTIGGKMTKGVRANDRRNVREWEKPTWKKASEVEAGDWLFVPRLKGHLRSGISTEQAWLMGLYVAEGYASSPEAEGNQVSLTLGPDRRVANRARQAILSLGWAERATVRDKTAEKTSLVVQFSSRKIADYLRLECGVGAHNKKIPHGILFSGNPEILRSFLMGYMDGDGCVGAMVSFGTVSRVLAHQLQLAFARLGGLINLYERKQNVSVIRGRKVKGSNIFIGSGGSQACFDAAGETRAKPARATSFASVQDDYILTPVKSVSSSPFSGAVYNLETFDHSYVAANVLTHNCALGHFRRLLNADRNKAQIAFDLAINCMILEAGFALPKGCLVPGEGEFKKFPKGLCAEEYYLLLTDEFMKKLSEKYKNGEGDGCGAVFIPDKVEGDGDGGDKAQNGVGNGEQEWKIAVAEAAQLAKQKGDIPGSLQGMIDDILKTPKLDWRTLLAQFLATHCRDDYSFTRPSKRGHLGAVLPVLWSEHPGHIAVAIDTSGSISDDELHTFCSELGGIMACLPTKVSIIWHDCRVHRVDTWEPADGAFKARPVGRGGTSHVPVFDYLDKECEKPVALVCLTDLETSFPGHAPEFPTLWITTVKHDAPFGDVVEL